MLTFSGSTISTAAPDEVWMTLCDPLRFSKSWKGITPNLYGDAGECTTYSCMVSDRVFRWHLSPTDGGTEISVHVDILDGEPTEVDKLHGTNIASALRWLAEVVAVASERRTETPSAERTAPRPLRDVSLEPR
jgi:hypothetical protein